MTDQDQRPRHLGGSIENTLAGRAELEIVAVLREAWQRIDGIKGMVIAGMLMVYAAVLLVTLLMGEIFGYEDQSPVGSALMQLLFMMIVYPFMAGVFMLGVRRSVGEAVRFEEQFVYYRNMLPIVAVGALQSLVTFAGLALFILPGIYLMFALSLAVPLKAERDLPITDCLLVSIRLVNRKFFEVAVLSLAAMALSALGVLSVVGWIWTIPWTLMILAIIYRQLAGYTHSGGPGQSAPSTPGSFDA